MDSSIPPTGTASGITSPPSPSAPTDGRAHPPWWPAIRAALDAIASRLGDRRGPFAWGGELARALEEPPNLTNIAEFASSLLKAGALDEAECLYGAIAQSLPSVPIGYAGLARTAARRRAWSDALTRWDGVIDRFPKQAHPNWPVERAAVLVELDRLDEAEQILRTLIESADTRAAGLAALARLAMRREWWPEALEWSETLRDEGGEQRNPQWVAERANALAALGRLDEAERIFREMMGRPATELIGMIGLARVLIRRLAWPDALATLDAAFARASDLVPPYTRALRAKVLSENGRMEEAEVILRELVLEQPGSIGTLVELCEVLLAGGRPEETLRVLPSSDLGLTEASGLTSIRLRSLIMLRRFPEARADFWNRLERAVDPAALTMLFQIAPRLFEGWLRTKIWLAIEKKVDWLATSRQWPPIASLSALRLRLFLALRNYEAFLVALGAVKDMRSLGVHEGNIRAVATALRRPDFPDYGRPRIFGIGLSKTGTTSLAAALMALGFSTVDWLNTLTGELMNDDDLDLFDAFTDTPSCQNFEKYYYMFPSSKFIYTVRRADDWERSWASHLKRWYLISGFQEAKKRHTDRNAFHFGTQYSDIYMALYFNHNNFSEAFQAYDQRVRRFFADKPSERFLEFNIFDGDGWEKLCKFVGRDTPSAAFPWQNRARIEPSPSA